MGMVVKEAKVVMANRKGNGLKVRMAYVAMGMRRIIAVRINLLCKVYSLTTKILADWLITRITFAVLIGAIITTEMLMVSNVKTSKLRVKSEKVDSSPVKTIDVEPCIILSYLSQLFRLMCTLS